MHAVPRPIERGDDLDLHPGVGPQRRLGCGVHEQHLHRVSRQLTTAPHRSDPTSKPAIDRRKHHTPDYASYPSEHSDDHHIAAPQAASREMDRYTVSKAPHEPDASTSTISQRNGQPDLGAERSVRTFAANVAAVSRARWYFRHADVRGPRIRVWGHPRVVNKGRMLIGASVRIRSTVATIEFVTDADGTLEIGESTFINFGTTIAASHSVRIGRECQIGPHCMFMDNAYHSVDPEQRNVVPPSLPITIGDNVWVGARAIILPGVTIGDHSVIGAGSVVTRDVPARTFAAGAPCRVVRSI